MKNNDDIKYWLDINYTLNECVISMNRNTRIKLDDTAMSATIKLSEGNPGALTVCIEILEKGEDIDPDHILGGLGILLIFDSLAIYGSRIWMLYKDVCKQDIVKTVAVLRAAQLGILYEDKLQHAVDNYGEGIDIEDIHKKVRQRLPRFSDTLIISGSESVSTVKDI